MSSFSSNRVFRYSEVDGSFTDIFVTNANGALSQPHGLAFGPDGNLYVASAGNDRVTIARTLLSQTATLQSVVDGAFLLKER